MVPIIGSRYPNTVDPIIPATGPIAASGMMYSLYSSTGTVGSASITSHSCLGLSRMFFTRSFNGMRALLGSDGEPGRRRIVASPAVGVKGERPTRRLNGRQAPDQLGLAANRPDGARDPGWRTRTRYP